MEGPTMSLSLKEIYDEVKKTSAHIENISVRLERVERTIEKQEDNKTSFWQKFALVVVAAFIPVALAIIFFVAKGGGL